MSASDSLISASERPTATATLQVGGKAASLFRMCALGFSVPPFFVVTVGAYREAAGGSVGADLTRLIADAVQGLGGDRYDYAVRSSGVAEDSADYSYAGVFDTFLNVRGTAAVVEAIEQCFRSHGSARADAYRDARNVASDPAMAVIVQRMVRAEWSGVSFSADPLTQALSVCVINATEGLGEDLVSGRVNPEEIRLDAATGAVLEDRLPPGAKPLPAGLRGEILDATRRLAEQSGFPQDVEWAVEGGHLQLLQSRPITTIAAVFHNRALEPWCGSGTPDAPDRVWTRAYADEIWTPPVTPLFYDIHNLTVVTTGRIRADGDSQPLPPDIFKYYRAAPYMDASVLCRLYAGLPKIARRDTLLPLFPPEYRDRLTQARWRWSAWLVRAWRCEIVAGSRWGITRNYRWLERAWPAFLARARPLCDLDVTALSDAGLDAHVTDIWGLAGSVAPECEVAVLYYAHDIKLLLAGLLERWCGKGEQLYGEVSAGLDGSETVRETEAIWSIAQALRAAGPQAVARAKSDDWLAFRAAAATLGAADVVGRFESFLRDHRHRGANYKDFIYPRWGDAPDLLWGHVRAFLDAASRRPTQANAASAASRRVAQQTALRSLRGALAPLRRVVLRALFRGNEIYAGIRDNHRYYYDHVWWLVRRAYLEIGRRLQLRSLLGSPEDALFLVRTEIDALKQGALTPAVAAARIAVRRQEWRETKRRQPPKFLRHGYVGDASETVHLGGGRGLKGLAASSGQVVGRACVLHDVSELARLDPGDILVARQTDPGWTPAFARIGGLILETGGVLAHGASLCREYGLPCVTAIESATALIRDGDRVALDGGAGTVEILSPP
jgi:rifampicin phosphotransferase